jgi:hypothetical protein
MMHCLRRCRSATPLSVLGFDPIGRDITFKLQFLVYLHEPGKGVPDYPGFKAEKEKP